MSRGNADESSINFNIPSLSSEPEYIFFRKSIIRFDVSGFNSTLGKSKSTRVPELV